MYTTTLFISKIKMADIDITEIAEQDTWENNYPLKINETVDYLRNKSLY